MPENRKNKDKLAAKETAKTGANNRNEKTQNLKKRGSAIRLFAFSPAFNVAALVFLLLAVFAGLRLFSARRSPAQVSFVERAESDAPSAEVSENRNYPAPDIFKGEVYETTIRLRETGALGMAISLAIFAETQEKGSVPFSLDKILGSIKERGLLPPGIQFQNGEIVSPSSRFVVRYQSEPLRFEICASPKRGAPAGSPALMLRFPLASLDKRTITYFQSARADGFELPEPFAPLERIVAAGWTIEQWRGEILPKNADAARILAEEKQLLGAPGKNQ
jgi:hypothetical protein